MTFQIITNQEVAQIHQNCQFSKNSIFHFSEKTSKNQKNIKKWEFFKKTLYYHAKKYKLYHIKLLDAQKLGFLKKIIC